MSRWVLGTGPARGRGWAGRGWVSQAGEWGDGERMGRRWGQAGRGLGRVRHSLTRRPPCPNHTALPISLSLHPTLGQGLGGCERHRDVAGPCTGPGLARRVWARGRGVGPQRSGPALVLAASPPSSQLKAAPLSTTHAAGSSCWSACQSSTARKASDLSQSSPCDDSTAPTLRLCSRQGQTRAGHSRMGQASRAHKLPRPPTAQRVLSCVQLCEPRDCSPPGSPVHGRLQARILGWVAISCSRGSSQPRDQTQVSYTAGRFFTI